MKIKGKFDVVLNSVDTYAEGVAGNNLARMTIDKTFYGTLAATSKGEMLSAMTATNGSAGYVAIEQVQGSLNGKSGGFILQHSGVMSDGHHNLILAVVPDSGTDALTGLSGSMVIIIDEGQHYYEFDFNLVD